MGKYILMNQNVKILKFEYDRDLDVILHIDEVYNVNYAPLVLKNAKEEKMVIEFNHWFHDRGIPDYRDNVKEILEEFQLNNVKELINRDYALSLSDQYWIKPEAENISWNEINYFDNNYDSFTFANATYGSGAGESLNQTQSVNSDKTPNNTSNGQLKKVWIKKENENYLYKGSGTIHNFEPINEVIATKICEILNVPHVKYSLEVIHGKKQDTLASVCKCMLQKNEEIIPAYSILSEKADKVTKTEKDYELYLNILKEHEVPNAEEYLQKMFLLDYILLNEDRHLNNFGVIRNVENLKWVRICPIFDTGRSMNTNVTTNYWDFNEGEIKCFTNNLVSSKVLESILYWKLNEKQIKALENLKNEYKNMLKKYQSYTKLTDKEIKLLIKGYQTRIEIVKKYFAE